jgi:hypothetical protein
VTGFSTAQRHPADHRLLETDHAFGHRWLVVLVFVKRLDYLVDMQFIQHRQQEGYKAFRDVAPIPGAVEALKMLDQSNPVHYILGCPELFGKRRRVLL